jgi:peptidoglycan/xylan/chitin deacetylase (PgdA/CDA1 family)
MLVHRHSWIWAVLTPESRRILCIGDGELAPVLREIGFEAREAPAPGAALVGEAPDTIIVSAEGEAATESAARAAAMVRPGGAVAVPVGGGGLTPPQPVSRFIRGIELAGSPVTAAAAEVAARRTAAAMRESGLRVSRILTGDRARPYGLGSGGWLDRRRLPVGSIVVGTTPDRGPSVTEVATEEAARALGRPLHRRAASVFESGKLAVELVDSEGVAYYLWVVAGAADRQLNESVDAVRAIRGAKPPPMIRDRIIEPTAEGHAGLAHFRLEQKAPGRHPVWMTPRIWEDCLEFLVALHHLPAEAPDLELRPGRSDLGAAVELLGRHGGSEERRALERLEREIDDRVGDLPPCGGHGDFWNGNLIVQRGRLRAVLDWEWAAADALPLLDLMDLTALSGRRRRGLAPGPRVTEVLWPLAERGGDKRFRWYCLKTGTPWDVRTLEGLVMAYWLLRTVRIGWITPYRLEDPGWYRDNVLAPLAQLRVAPERPRAPAERAPASPSPAIDHAATNGHRRRPAQPRTDVIALCYHAISPDWPAELAVTPDRFEGQLRLLVDRGYRGATFSEAVLDPPAAKVVAITFDDAYTSVFERAFPILERLGFPATVFVPTAFPGNESPLAWPGIDHWLSGPHRRELMPMSWGQLSDLMEAGWEIGSHTHTHPMLTDLDDESLARELAESRRSCEANLGQRCRSLAYPYGDHDERVIAAARIAGYETACTLSERLHAPSPLRWPRIGVNRVDYAMRFRLKVSPALRRLRSTGGWTVVGALRGRPKAL